VVGTGIQELIDYLAERLWASPPTPPPNELES
jgi:hypothetical protein